LQGGGGCQCLLQWDLRWHLCGACGYQMFWQRTLRRWQSGWSFCH
jgi:hypothetical protein